MEDYVWEICAKHDVLVFSDEIHCDITYPGEKHIPFAVISKEFADYVIAGFPPVKHLIWRAT